MHTTSLSGIFVVRIFLFHFHWISVIRAPCSKGQSCLESSLHAHTALFSVWKYVYIMQSNRWGQPVRWVSCTQLVPSFSPTGKEPHTHMEKKIPSPNYSVAKVDPENHFMKGLEILSSKQQTCMFFSPYFIFWFLNANRVLFCYMKVVHFSRCVYVTFLKKELS